ncbi:MAG: class I tRNA ligase family protein, partial [bacterium]|nr:class I tRNA ligase family protein [bacterium]
MNLPKREEEILKFWEEHRIFEKTLAKTKRGKRFVFYEGPPTANGSPGIHHFESRAFKDLIPRYKTMRGYFVERKAGWDTHGLPVEIQVEKELGLKSKKDIERYGIAAFNAKCRESVWRYREEWTRFTKRIGYWLDLAHPYVTSEASYIETLWWVISQFAKKKLLYRDFKVVPWCPRCGTALSTHELGQGYDTVKDRSVYVRFRLKTDNPRWRHAALLSWTTTPWTLPGNVALAINPEAEYVCIPDPAAKRRWLILGREPFREMVEKSLFPAAYRSSLMLDDIDIFKGKEILGLAYEPPFAVPELASETSHRIYPADFVTMAEGTGVVHTAVMYGDDDYRLGTAVGLPKFHTVDEGGHFIKSLGEDLGGLFVKDPKTGERIIASLKARELLFAEEMYEHEYPFCWRCDTPLLYYARQAWWVKTTAVKKKLVANNKKINWVPEHLKTGRFGEFLGEVRDWAFSRERYWGTALPVWQCAGCERHMVIGSFAELTASSFEPRTKLILARHAEAENNRHHLLSSEVGEGSPPLSEAGRQRAGKMAKELRRSGIDLIFSSDVRRARETAEAIGRAVGKPVKLDPRLREISMGEFEGKPDHAYGDHFQNQAEKYEKRVPGGESLREVKKRMLSFALEMQANHPGKTVLAVSHGDPLWALRGALSGFDDRRSAGDGSLFVPRGAYRAHVVPNLPFDEEGDIDLHRPHVDEIRLKCERCSGEMRRVPEVCDVWFDSGAMPFAQAHYPFEHKNDLPFPADYISEAIDQTRGWFYTLLAVSTLLGRGAPYRNVISLGHVLDARGQKMSKSKGNIVEPFPLMEQYGTDAIRWYFYTVNAPGDSKR